MVCDLYICCCYLLYISLHFGVSAIWSCCICSREDLLRIPEIHINPLGDRIVDAFFPVHHERQVCMKFLVIFKYETACIVTLLWVIFQFSDVVQLSPSVLWHCWLGGRKGIRPVKNWAVGCWCGFCLERGADLHMAQLMPLPLTVSCFSKIQIGFAFLVPAHPGSPGQRAVKRVCVCACVRACMRVCSLTKVLFAFQSLLVFKKDKLTSESILLLPADNRQ